MTVNFEDFPEEIKIMIENDEAQIFHSNSPLRLKNKIQAGKEARNFLWGKCDANKKGKGLVYEIWETEKGRDLRIAKSNNSFFKRIKNFFKLGRK